MQVSTYECIEILANYHRVFNFSLQVSLLTGCNLESFLFNWIIFFKLQSISKSFRFAKKKKYWFKFFLFSSTETGKFSEEVLRSYDESRRLFVCRLCGTERKRSDRLALHLQWHEDHPGESYQTRNNCKICGRFNATYFMLKMHMTRMHTDMPKTFKCQHEGCGKFFRVSNCCLAIGCLKRFLLRS